MGEIDIMNNCFSFRLKSLEIIGHPVLQDINIQFCDDDNLSDSFYTTCVIGPNGTGKSHLVSAIAMVFTDINRILNNEKRRTGYNFIVKYYLYGDLYCISSIRKFGRFSYYEVSESHFDYLYAEKNGNRINLGDLFLPNRIIASTMTTTDKFLAKTDNFYRYRGIRNESSVSTTGTRTIIRKTVSSLIECISSKNTFHDELRLLLNKLGLEEHLFISYGMRYKDIFLYPDITSDQIRHIFNNWSEYFTSRNTPPWGYQNFINTIQYDSIALEATAHFLSKKAVNNRHSWSVVKYDLMDNPTEFQNDALAIKTLTQLDLLSFPSISVVKNGSYFGMENSSSGETHLLCQFVGIMSDIQNESLILIDEPENSSHPDWQMNYIGWLKEIFRDYSNCHFIIATHSPLILANLKASESTIVRLSRDSMNSISDEGGMRNGCYSWTVDEILKEVMKMKSTHTKEYNIAMSEFECALYEEDGNKALKAFNQLKSMIRPENELLELLTIQMIGLNYTEND